MKKMIAAGLMMMSKGMASWAEPVEKKASVVTTTTTVSQSQPEAKKEQAQPAQSAPAQVKKPIELNFRTF